MHEKNVFLHCVQNNILSLTKPPAIDCAITLHNIKCHQKCIGNCLPSCTEHILIKGITECQECIDGP